MYNRRFTDFSINRLLGQGYKMDLIPWNMEFRLDSSFQTPTKNPQDEKSDESDKQNIPLLPFPSHFNLGKQQTDLRRNYHCHFCKASFDRPSLLKRHIRTHTGEKPFACFDCEKRFATTCALRAHSRIHQGIKPFVCKICNKAFTADSNLHYHMFTHKRGDLPHKCPQCVKGFSTPSELSKHMPVHTHQWPFVCKCGKHFAKPNLYKRHMMKHLGLSDQKCPHCSKKFTIPSKLNEHVKSMHGLAFNNPINDDDVSIDTLSVKIAKMDD